MKNILKRKEKETREVKNFNKKNAIQISNLILNIQELKKEHDNLMMFL